IVFCRRIAPGLALSFIHIHSYNYEMDLTLKEYHIYLNKANICPILNIQRLDSLFVNQAFNLAVLFK
ncbi:MAG: hypothetical protein ACOCV1_07755, partial [Bacillota bacterium]